MDKFIRQAVYEIMKKQSLAHLRTFSYAYPHAPINEQEVIDYADDVSTGTVFSSGQGLALLTGKCNYDSLQRSTYRHKRIKRLGGK